LRWKCPSCPRVRWNAKTCSTATFLACAPLSVPTSRTHFTATSRKVTDGSKFERPGLRRNNLHSRQPRLGIAEARKFNAHFVHDRQVQAAKFAVLIAGIGKVEHTSTIECSAETTHSEHGQLRVVVPFARPHVRK